MSDFEFIKVDAQETINEMISEFEAATGRTLSPADPYRAIVLYQANTILMLRAQFNEKAKQNLRRYATGEYLDRIGEDIYCCERLKAGKATTTMRVYISEAQEIAINIAKGTRFIVGEIQFESLNIASVTPGEMYVDVLTQCVEEGTVGNGYVPGQINTIVKPFNLYDKCENITESEGGTDVETDDEYRERMQQSFERYSTAGPEGAYKYYAKSVSTSINDVYVIATEGTGEVDIYVLCKKGELPTDELLELVTEAVNDREVRPLTDNVTVHAPEVVEYDLNVKYYIAAENESQEESLKVAIEEAIEQYKIWQREKMGRDINSSYLSYMVIKAGAKRLEITSPTFTKIKPHEIAICNSATVTYGGIEDD